MTLILVRHGETALNAARVLQPADTPLGARGIAQAVAVARRIAGLGPVALLSSDLERARQTADAIATATGLPLETEPLLQERSFGDWRGRPWTDLPCPPAALVDAPPGGESMADFEHRVAAAWAAVLRRQARSGGTLVVVTHGLVIHRLLLAHAALPAGTTMPQQLGNCSLSLLDAAPPHAVTLLGCTRHLD